MKAEKLQWENWRDDLSVGVDAIDDDHKEILAVIAKLSRAHDSDETSLREALRIIADYSERHFAREERMLEAVGYAFLDQHRLRHESFRAFVQAAARIPDMSPAELFSYLVDWWIGHIATDDKFYRGSLAGKEQAVTAALANR